jgi:hypothetical protein
VIVPPPPLHPSKLPAGTVLRAGRGTSTVLPDLDFETYSEAGFEWCARTQRWRQPAGATGTATGLPLVGVVNYVAHASFRVLTMAYNLKDGAGERTWVPGMPPPLPLLNHVASGGLLEAWNVGFERRVWAWGVANLGWPPIDRLQWRCAMAKARAHALPGGLGAAGEVLSLSVLKDAGGKAMLDRFSRPRNPTKDDPRLRVTPIWTSSEEARVAAELFAHRTAE